MTRSSIALFDEIQHRDPKPLRTIRPEIPAEMERIVLKCLAKRATDRYGSAAELLEDLAAWLACSARPTRDAAADAVVAPVPGHIVPKDLHSFDESARPPHDRTFDVPVTPVPARIVPKGLRSFDEQDADYFLELLPGPRDREGLPDIIRFWKTRIEKIDADATFAVGVMYGPSGCGKSSLMKAGLLPRLAAHVLPIFVEATPSEPEEAAADVSPPADRGYYQLTHDYLVPSLCDWLTRKQKETRRGRAELRLADQAALWNAKPERRHLPSFLEFARIRMLTKPQDWTDSQQKIMRAATRHYGAIGTGLLALLLVAGIVIQQFLALQRRKSVDDALMTLQSCHGLAVPLMIDNLRRLPRSLVQQKLGTLYQSVDDIHKLPVAYALADPDFGQVDRQFLLGVIADAPAEECDNIAVALSHDRQAAVQDLQSAAATATENKTGN